MGGSAQGGYQGYYANRPGALRQYQQPQIGNQGSGGGYGKPPVTGMGLGNQGGYQWGGPKPDFGPPFNGQTQQLPGGLGIRQMAPSTLPPGSGFDGRFTPLPGGMGIRQMGPTQAPPGFNQAASQWQPQAVDNTSGYQGLGQIQQQNQQARDSGYSDRYGIQNRFNGTQFDRAGAVNDYYSQLSQLAQRTGRGGQQVNLFDLNNQGGEYTGPMNMAMINELNGGYWKPGAMGSFTGIKDGQHYFLGNPLSEYAFNENFKTGLPGG